MSENIHEKEDGKEERLPESAANMEPTEQDNRNGQSGSASDGSQNGAQNGAQNGVQNEASNGTNASSETQGRYRGVEYPVGRDREMAAAIEQERATTTTDEENPVERVYRGVRYQEGGERYAPEKIQVTRENDSGLVQWFYDRRVANKQLTGLLASKMLSVLGVIGVSLILLTITGRRQLLSQTVSELSATAKDLNDVSAEGALSDAALREAAEDFAEFGNLDETLKQDARSALQTRLELNQL
ncbi:MAG: hypothetical protein AAF528_10170, partial [Cyanobacteria bacterium P01_C01_bin.121]